jgi:Family of unknown function (DUF6786)
MIRTPVLFVLALAAATCGSEPPPLPAQAVSGPESTSFGQDLAFLRAHTAVVVLVSADGAAQIAIAPGYQGRVMTSTATGLDGASYGYIHRPVIELGTRQPHMTVLGGEDRFWLGPEGGQYALYFPPGSPFDTNSWQVPEPFDWGAWPVTGQTTRDVTFTESMALTNYAGTRFALRVDRTIRLLDGPAISAALGMDPGPNTHVVAYESDNRITNTGPNRWTTASGLVSIWILGMMRPAPRTTIVLPYQPGTEAAKGPVVNDAYFGAPPPNRLRIGDRAVFFRGDGKARGKIGLPQPRARDIAGSYDPDSRVLTLKQFTVPAQTEAGYVNSMWDMQKHPYGGDVVNSYNDGPLGPGQPPLGPFYEIESSSPAAALAPGETMGHVHRTMHLQGPEQELDAVTRAVLGVTLAEITSSLP